MARSSADRRRWRRAPDERLRHADLVVERELAEVDRSSGRDAVPRRQRADEVLDGVYAELVRRDARDAS